MSGVDHAAAGREGHAAKLAAASRRRYNVALGYLRAFVVVVVVGWHAVLAYVTFAPSPPESLVDVGFAPIVDNQRFFAFDPLVIFTDRFMMSLMFFLSGLFVWKSAQRKGWRAFLRDRAIRLGLPFLGAIVVVMPLALYPTYLETGADPSLRAYLRALSDVLAHGFWQIGPAWFIWVLLLFDMIAAGLSALIPKWGETLGRLVSGPSRHPAAFFLFLLAVSSAAYVPMASVLDPQSWSGIGPFLFQTTRLLHYAVYFFVGVGVGTRAIEEGLLAPDGKLARRWPIWLVAALVAFGLNLVLLLQTMGPQSESPSLALAEGFTFVLTCAASSLAFLAMFVRFVTTPVRVFDSIRDNSYGIYLVHYAFVTWLQYALLDATLPAIAKATIVFLGATGLSWGTVAALRRIPAVGRVI